jgi:hypothetical protein
MDNTIILGVITAASGLMGSGLGVIASSRLTNYRLEMLEEEVKNLSKRTDDVTILKEQMKGVLEDVRELKKG